MIKSVNLLFAHLRPHSQEHIDSRKYRYLRQQVYLRRHVNAFTYVSINTPRVTWGKLKYIE